MADYRCAACGSKHVVIDTETGGIKYNYAKGAVGTVILGVGGAAAGIENKTQQVYKCAACGLSLSYAMPDGLKKAIDLGVENAEARNYLDFNGVHVEWDYLTTKYPNIERGAADTAIEKKQQLFASKEAFRADLLKKMIAYVNTPLEFEIPTWDAEAQKAWEAQYGAAWRKRDSEIEELLRKVEEVKALLEDDSKQRLAAAQRDYDALVASHAAAENELASLGFFKLKEKRALTAKIEELKQKIAKSKPSEWEEEEKLSRLRIAANEDCKQRILAAWNSYSGPVSPKTQFEVHKFLEPIRIKKGDAEISTSQALFNQIKQAEDLFRKAHPTYAIISPIPPASRTPKQCNMNFQLCRDCDLYRNSLICLLALVAAKMPLTSEDLVDLCLTKKFPLSLLSELDRENQNARRHYKEIDFALLCLTNLGLVQTLCVTGTDIKPELHNCQYLKFSKFIRNMVATAKL